MLLKEKSSLAYQNRLIGFFGINWERCLFFILIVATGYVLWSSLESKLGFNSAFAATCPATGRTYQEASLDVWVIGIKKDLDPVVEIGPIPQVKVSLASINLGASEQDIEGCGASVGSVEQIRTQSNGYVRLAPINPSLNPFALSLSGLPNGATWQGATQNLSTSPTRRDLRVNVSALSFREGERKVLKVYYSLSEGAVPAQVALPTLTPTPTPTPSPTPTTGPSGSFFERSIVGLVNRIRGNRAPTPTLFPTTTPVPTVVTPGTTQPLNGTPQTGPNTWVLLGSFWALYIGHFLSKRRFFP